MENPGDQNIDWAQNATLTECRHNGVDVHLLEGIDADEYVYCVRIELVDKAIHRDAARRGCSSRLQYI